jgi:hypothetical protein
VAFVRRTSADRLPATGSAAEGVKRAAMRRWRYALLLLPFVGTLIPPLYNRAEPPLFGMPFFYWYQLGWVLLTAALLGLFVAATRERDV